MSAPSQVRPVIPSLVDAYRSVTAPVASNDWAGLQERVRAAEELADRAFVQGDRSAWDVVQVVEWRLQRSASLRPLDPGDVLVLDRLYAVEEGTLSCPELPAGLSPPDFCSKLQADLMQFAAGDSELMDLLLSGQLALEDWQYLTYQWLPSTIDFTRTVALASVSLPRQQARLLYENLYDEGGRGDWARSHYEQLRSGVSHFGVDITDEHVMLRWAAPEVIALTNTLHRQLWHREPGWALGALYLTELLIPSDLTRVRQALGGQPVPDEALEYFHEHIELDVEHSAEWLGVIEDLIDDHASQKTVYVAAMEQGKSQRAAWDAALAGWREWKETGTPPHLPFDELAA
jgi:hypothetical protein